MAIHGIRPELQPAALAEKAAQKKHKLVMKRLFKKKQEAIMMPPALTKLSIAQHLRA